MAKKTRQGAVPDEGVDYNGIPDFLRIPLEKRREAWERRGVTGPVSQVKYVDPVTEHQNELLKRHADERREKLKAKNYRNLARMKAKNEGLIYDRKKKIWRLPPEAGTAEPEVPSASGDRQEEGGVPALGA